MKVINLKKHTKINGRENKNYDFKFRNSKNFYAMFY